MAKDSIYWSKFVNEHYSPSWSWHSERVEGDSIWQKEVFDWEFFKEELNKNGLTFNKAGWSEHWGDEYIFIHLYCDSISRIPTDSDKSKLIGVSNSYGFVLTNKSTDCNLGYRGYDSLHEYIFEKFAEAYYNNDDWTESKNKFTTNIMKLLIEGFKETSQRICKSIKSKKVQKRLQTIENEIDNAICNLAEEWKQYDVEFLQDKGSSQNISTEYTFEKIFEGYVDLRQYCIRIRKDIKGNYDLCWRLDDWKMSKMVHFKSNITEQDMINVITGLFDKYLKIPSKLPIYNIPNELLK